jgi:MoxR-like ATPase
MFQIKVGYPSEEEELDIVRRTTARIKAEIDAVLDANDVMEIQRIVRDVPVADHVIRYALRLVRATRVHEAADRPDFVNQYLQWGAGPRASQYLILGAKARAILDGRNHVEPADIRAVAHPVLRHRLIPNFNAEADGVDSDQVIDRLLQVIDPDTTDAETRKQLDQVMR